MRVSFEDVPLESDQKDLLAAIVEADRAVAPNDRHPFILFKGFDGTSLGSQGAGRSASL